MRVDVSPRGVRAGMSNEPLGTHTSKTTMLPELRGLLAAAPGRATYEDYVRTAIDENALNKATAATRAKTFAMLRQLYGLKGTVAVFAALRELWHVETAAQPMLALLCASARDPLLRCTADLVLALQPNDPVGPVDIAGEVAGSFPNRYNPRTLHHIGQNVGASWVQAGLLRGTLKKVRSHPKLTHPAVVYALYLGHLEGLAGPALLTSFWARLFDTSASTVRTEVEAAARLGWLDYAAAGGMTQIGFGHLDQLVASEAA